MPSPVSQLTTLHNLIRTAPTLNGWNNVRVLLGSGKMAKTGAPPRIVMFPTEAPLGVAREMDGAIIDADRTIVAHLWGKDFDELEELETRFLRALEYQASPQPSSAAPTIAPGIFYELRREDWDVTQDADKQGEAVFVSFTAIASLDRGPLSLGLVQSTLIVSISTTLTSPMGVSDATAAVAATTDFPPAGYATIDSEQVRYTGVTATSLTGLVRGSNGTTAATHASNATVTPVAHV